MTRVIVSGLLLALTTAVLATAMQPSVGEGIQLEWSAPPGCPQGEAVRAAIDLNLAREEFGDELDAVEVRGSIDGDASGWTLHVDTELPSGTVRRDVESRDCAELAEAAGLIIAVALDPLRVSDTARASREPLVSAAALAPPTAEPAKEDERAPKLEARPRARDADGPGEDQAASKLAVDLRIGGLGEFGGLDVLRYGVWAGVGLKAKRFRVDVAGQYWGPRSVFGFDDQPDAGVVVQLGGVAGRGCVVPTDGSLEFAMCLGAEAGVARARGIGIERSKVSTRPWMAIVIGQELAWTSRRKVGVWVAADAMIHIVRPQWTLEGLGVAAKTRPVGFRLVLGPTLRI